MTLAITNPTNQAAVGAYAKAILDGTGIKTIEAELELMPGTIEGIETDIEAKQAEVNDLTGLIEEGRAKLEEAVANDPNLTNDAKRKATLKQMLHGTDPAGERYRQLVQHQADLKREVATLTRQLSRTNREWEALRFRHTGAVAKIQLMSSLWGGVKLG